MSQNIHPGQMLQALVAVKNAGGVPGTFFLDGSVKRPGSDELVASLAGQSVLLLSPGQQGQAAAQLATSWAPTGGPALQDGELFDVELLLHCVETSAEIVRRDHNVIRHKAITTLPIPEFVGGVSYSVHG